MSERTICTGSADFSPIRNAVVGVEGETSFGNVVKLFKFEGLSRAEAEEAKAGNAHIVLNQVSDEAGNQRQILRQNMPFGSLGEGEFGTARSGGRNHAGIDISGRVGDPIESFGPGRVIFSGTMRGSTSK